jgi:hypothetical protein
MKILLSWFKKLDLKIAAAHINDCNKEMKIQRSLKAI